MSTVHISEVLGFLRNFEEIIKPAETVEEALYLLEQQFLQHPEIGFEIRQVSSAKDKQMLVSFISGLGINPAAHCWWLHKGGYEAFLRKRREMVQQENKARRSKRSK